MSSPPSDPIILLVCSHRRLGSGACGNTDGFALAGALRLAIKNQGLDWQVQTTGCLGQCGDGPNIKASPGGPFVNGCTPDGAEATVARLLATWRPRG